MSIRLPTAAEYAAKVNIEQKWLPQLAPYLSLKIPDPIAMGNSSQNYPWHWSVYRWIEGESANCVDIDEKYLPHIAQSLAHFLHELHAIDLAGPAPGAHNFYRGAHPSVYDDETKEAINTLQNYIEVNAATALWHHALNSKWHKKPVWIHGDLSAGNIILKNNQLAAIIDWGGMAVGDPACDLVIAWTFFNAESRNVFKSLLSVDENTWNRARGWALWKALITLAELEDKNNPEALKQRYIIDQILNQN